MATKNPVRSEAAKAMWAARRAKVEGSEAEQFPMSPLPEGVIITFEITWRDGEEEKAERIGKEKRSG